MFQRFWQLTLRVSCLLTICSVILIFKLQKPFGFIQKPSSISNESDIKYILAWTADTGNVKLFGWSYPELNGFQQAGCPEHREMADLPPQSIVDADVDF